jgi:hypothetical protein
MKKENDAFEQLFRSRLEDTELPLDIGKGWEQLQKDIPLYAATRRRLYIRRYAVAASFVLLFVGASAAFRYFSLRADDVADAFNQVATLPELPISDLSPAPKLPQQSLPTRKALAANEAVNDNEQHTVSVSISMSITIKDDGYDGRASYDRQTTETPVSTERTAVNRPETTPGIADQTPDRSWSIGAYVGKSFSRREAWTSGVSISKKFSKFFALESGLNYGQLRGNETLRYIGIPLKARFTLHADKRLNLYASAGGMLEKGIGESVKSEPVQPSLLASLGIEYKLSNRVSVYAEPSLQYHIDNNTLAAAYADKPLNMNLLCGLRMSY